MQFGLLMRTHHDYTRSRIPFGILCLFLFLSGNRADAQLSYLKFETLSLEHGLSQSSVRCIHQDRRGFIWFGTEDGLNRYDGYTFSVFKPVPNDPKTLSSSFIRAITDGADGIIWIGTNGGGFNRFDPTTERFRRYTAQPGDENSLSHNYVWAIQEDRHGKLWIGTDGGGVDMFDPLTESFVHFRHDPEDAGSLSSNSVIALLVDSRGWIWIGTRDGGLNCLDPESGRITRHMNDARNPGSISSNDVRAIIEDGKGNIWAGTFGGGLNTFDMRSGKWKAFCSQEDSRYCLSNNYIYSLMIDSRGSMWIGTNGGGLNRFIRQKGLFLCYRHDSEKPQSLSNNITFSMYEDASGVLWFGSEFGGLSKLDYLRYNFHHYRSDPDSANSLNDNSVWALCMDSDNMLWIGTRIGGLNSLDRATGNFRHFLADPDNPHALSTSHIRCIFEDSRKVLWVGTDGGGLHRLDRKTGRFTRYMHDPDDPTSISGNRVYCILEDSRGRYWIGTRTGGLNLFDPETGRFRHYRHEPNNPQSVSNDFVYVVREQHEGKLWVGTFAGGLNLFDPATGRWKHYRSDTDDPSSLSSDCVLSLSQTSEGELWVGTGGGGINKFDAESETFQCWDERDGLANNVVYSLLEDRKGRLWISTNQGISRFNSRTGEFRNYTSLDGLQSNEFNGGAYASTHSGEMFFGGINGFNAFYPENVLENSFVPPVYITDIKVFNSSLPIGGDSPLQRHISETDEIVLSYTQDVFSIDFVALNYTVPTKNKYRFMLEGVDEDWISADAEHRRVPYMNLAPGTYVFKVMGSNNDGVWNPVPATLRIVITPPFWQTWWFQSIVVLMIIAIGYLWVQRRLRTVRMKTELQAAHDAQMSIMPQGDPQVPGYDISGACSPAHEVGGDFFDYFHMRDDELFCVAVGDVSGKAMNSAMTAVLSSGMLYAHAAKSRSVGDIMSSLNGPMYRKTDRKMFTALCLFALHCDREVLSFTNAGLPLPLLKREGTVSTLTGTGPRLPLGSTEHIAYEESQQTLEHGDVLVICTDGLSEAINSNREFYGMERLQDLLERMDTTTMKASTIKSRILEDVQGFTNGSSRHDDMTVVVVKVASR